MGQILHGSARTTEVVRRAIHHGQESLRVLTQRYGINQKTLAKWKRRTAVKDLPTGPKDAHSTVLSIEEEAIIVAFRLTRSSLHRCLQRHGISRLPEVAGDKEPKRKFKTYPIGNFHIDIAEGSSTSTSRSIAPASSPLSNWLPRRAGCWPRHSSSL